MDQWTWLGVAIAASFLFSVLAISHRIATVRRRESRKEAEAVVRRPAAVDV